MQNYEIGKSYEFEVIEIRQDAKTGADYFALCDDTRDTYRVYNILKYQYEDVPDKIIAVVKELDSFERPKLKQETASIYQKIYEFGKEYTFKVTDIKQDFYSPTKAEYYELEDEWCVHRFYFKEQKYQIGAECVLLVEGVTDKGDLILAESGEENKKPISVTPAVVEEEETIKFNNCPILDLGEESTTLEYKTSIVFQKGEPHIDEQLFVIVKTLVAFMNAEGGDLYIGIHDKTRRVVGISADFDHLNEGNDGFNGQYDKSIDKYQLKIRHAIERLSQGVAEQLVEFEFPEIQGVQYCHISVKKAKRPVWVNRNLLFQRTGNRITLLEKDDITNFVYERMQISIKNVVDTEGLNVFDLTPEKLLEMAKEINNSHRAAIAAPKPTINDADVDYYIVWYNNGTWQRLRDASKEQNVFSIIPIRKIDKDSLLVFCYASGTINEVQLDVFLKDGKKKQLKLNTLGINGLNPNETPLNIFLVNTNHFLAVYGADVHGTEYVKVHRVTDVKPTGGAKNQGPRIIPANDKLMRFKLVPGECESKIRDLIFAKSKTREPGVPVSSVANSNEIEFLNTIN